MNNNKKGLGIVIGLTLILLAVLSVGIIRDRQISKRNAKDYTEWMASKGEGTPDSEAKDEPKEAPKEEPKDKENPAGTEELDFYGKLKNKKPVKMLILGDGLALSEGRNSGNGLWDGGVENWVKETYGCEVEKKSLAKRGSASAIGLDDAKSNDLSGYDLIITCFGQNDNNTLVAVDKFKANYEGIINEIKTKNPKATILPILPSTLTKNNQYRGAIQTLASNKGITVVDTRTEFEESGVPFNTLLNGELPNDKGYQLYTQAVSKVIKNAVK